MSGNISRMTDAEREALAEKVCEEARKLADFLTVTQGALGNLPDGARIVFDETPLPKR